MKHNKLKVGLLLWWGGEGRYCPILISYVDEAKNCFRFIPFSNNTETESICIIKNGEPNRIFEDFGPADKLKVNKYFSQKRDEASEKMNKSLSDLRAAQETHGYAVRDLNAVSALEKEVAKTLAKFEETLPTNS